MDRRLGALGLLDQADYLGQDRLPADPGGLKPKQAVGVQGSAHHRGAGPLRHRDGFARDHGFVHIGLPFHNLPVHRDLAARAHDDHIAGDHLLGGHLDLVSIPDHRGRLGLETHQLLDGLAGPALGPGLQKPAQGQEGGQHEGGVVKHELPGQNQLKCSQDAGQIGHPDTHAVHHVHVQVAVEEGPPGRPEDGQADVDKSRGGDNQHEIHLGPGQAHLQVMEGHQRQPQSQTHDHPPHLVPQILFADLLLHIGRILPGPAQVLISGLLHGRLDLPQAHQGGVVIHVSRLRGQVDPDRGHSLQTAYGLLHGLDAHDASHPADLDHGLLVNDPVPCAGDHLFQLDQIDLFGVVLHHGRLRAQVDLGRGHPIHTSQRFLHGLDAHGAGHSSHLQLHPALPFRRHPSPPGYIFTAMGPVSWFDPSNISYPIKIDSPTTLTTPPLHLFTSGSDLCESQTFAGLIPGGLRG